MVAKIRALVYGMRMCCNLGFLDVCLESDSVNLCNVVNSHTSWKIDGYVQQIRSLMDQGHFVLHHVLREANSVADHLASLSYSTATSQSFTSSHYPAFLESLLHLDKCGTTNFRWRPPNGDTTDDDDEDCNQGAGIGGVLKRVMMLLVLLG
ncbi:hypothetical protein ACH5RR_037038 [Cinchona calisaya]|uniref:RNase H type-1 domain-containing protein n=1 Tax=Cinchona calisaya TaxID=153742 RepID=A0ABD2Y4Z6_9GENT